MGIITKLMTEIDYLMAWKEMNGIPYVSRECGDDLELLEDEVVCYYGHVHMKHFTDCPYCTEGQ